MFQLTNQIAVVTGGAKGIGRGIASVLHQQGAKVIILDKDQAAGQATAKNLGADFYSFNVTDSQGIAQTFQMIAEKYGRLDILCSNIGIYPQAKIADMSEAEWDLIQTVNLKGTFLVVKAAAKIMRHQGYGRIVLTSSITGPITGYPGWAHYGSTKAGQLGFMRSAALEYAKAGITINAIQPGNVLTEGLKTQGESYLNEMKKTVPTHTLGAPEDIGTAVAFLASKEAHYITGQTIVVDGGQILPESFDAIL